MKDKTLFVLAIPPAIIFFFAGYYFEETAFVQTVAKFNMYGPEENVALSLIILFLLSLMVLRKVFLKPDEVIHKKGILALLVALMGFALFGIYALLFFMIAGFIYERFTEQSE